MQSNPPIKQKRPQTRTTVARMTWTSATKSMSVLIKPKSCTHNLIAENTRCDEFLFIELREKFDHSRIIVDARRSHSNKQSKAFNTRIVHKIDFESKATVVSVTYETSKHPIDKIKPRVPINPRNCRHQVVNQVHQ